MDAFDWLPFAAAVSLHASGVLVAWLTRLPLNIAYRFCLRVMLLALGALISGIAVTSATEGFGGWSFSALTLGAMIVAPVVHQSRDDADPTLQRIMATHQA
ncbi:MAG: hypothetical protein KDA37_13080 [Planctomycetales bacterium]|nr:hypothetical protein [Planctomycetales bacterium]